MRRIAVHACRLLPVLPAGHAACPTTAHCFEAKAPRPARQLAYLRPPSRLARAHAGPLHELRRASMDAARVSSCSCSLPQPNDLPTPCLGPIGAQILVCCPAARRASLGIRQPRSVPPSTAARHHQGNPDPNSGHESTKGDPLDLSHLFPGRERRRFAGIPAPPPPLRN
jgi:hypothetical protein